jgi:hypothetical protein
MSLWRFGEVFENCLTPSMLDGILDRMSDALIPLRTVRAE